MRLLGRTAPALALTTRALRLDIRSLPGSSLRMTLVALLMLALVQAVTFSAWRGAPGRELFQLIAYVNAIFVLILGISAFAGVIAEEKEQMTLGLLRLAGFSSISILLGKSIGALLSAVLLLGVQVPFAMLSVTLGGVGVSQVLAAYAVLGAFVLLVYSLSLLFSVMCVRTATAAWLTSLLIVGSWLLPVFAYWGGWGGPLSVGGLIGDLLFELESRSVWSGLDSAMAIGGTFDQAREVVVVHLVMAAVLFATAWAVFGRFNHQEVAASQARGWVGIRRRRSRSRPRPGLPAFFWKAFYFDAGGRPGVVVRVIVYGLAFMLMWSGIFHAGFSPDRLSEFGMAFGGLCLGLLALEFGVAASQVFHSEVKWKTLPSLFTTPFPAHSWAYRKASAFLAALTPGMVALVVAIILALTERHFRVGTFFVGWAVMFSNIILGAHLAAYLSLTMRRGAFAVAAVTVIALNVIWVALLNSCMSGGSEEGALSLWTIFLIGCSAVMHHRIGRKLTEVAGQ